MKKKILTMLPLAGLLLTGCGEAKVTLPKGYTSMNEVTDEAKLVAFGTKVAGTLNNTYKALFDGASFELGVKAKEIKYTDIDTDKEDPLNDSVVVSDLGFTVKIAERGLTEEIGKWQAAVEIKDLKAKVAVNIGELKINTEFKDVDLGVYMNKGNVYVNLGDKELKAAIADAGAAVIKEVVRIREAERQERGRIEYYTLTNEQIDKNCKALVDLVGDNYYIEDVNGLFGLDKILPKEGLGKFKTLLEDKEEGEGETSIVEDIAGAIAYSMTQLHTMVYTEESPFAFLKDQYVIADYEDGRVGVGINADIAEKAIMDNTKLTVKAEGAAVSNKDARIDSVGLKGDAKLVMLESETETKTISVEGLAVSLTSAYNIKNIKMPSFKKNKLLPLGLLPTLEIDILPR